MSAVPLALLWQSSVVENAWLVGLQRQADHSDRRRWGVAMATIGNAELDAAMKELKETFVALKQVLILILCVVRSSVDCSNDNSSNNIIFRMIIIKTMS